MKRGQNLGSPFTLYFMPMAVQCTMATWLHARHTKMIARIHHWYRRTKIHISKKIEKQFPRKQ